MKTIKNYLGLIFAIIVIVIVFLFGKSCGKTNSEVLTNTITVTNYKDTIFPKDTLYVDNIIPGEPKIIHDTTYKLVYLDSIECNTIRSYEDSTITNRYNIYSKKYIQGKFIAESRSIKLKVPLIIKDCTVVKKDSLIYKLPKYQFYVCILASPKMLVPTLDLSINKSTYTIGYDPFNKLPIIGYKYRLFKSKH